MFSHTSRGCELYGNFSSNFYGDATLVSSLCHSVFSPSFSANAITKRKQSCEQLVCRTPYANTELGKGRGIQGWDTCWRNCTARGTFLCWGQVKGFGYIHS